MIQFLVNVAGTDGSSVVEATQSSIANAVCGGADVLKIIKFAMTLINVLCIIVPIGLIVMISIDFVKNVIANNEDDMKKNTQMVIKRLLMCVGLFFVPIIVKTAMGLLGNAGIEYAKCVTIAQGDDLSSYEITWPEIINNITINFSRKKSTSKISEKTNDNSGSTDSSSSNNDNASSNNDSNTSDNNNSSTTTNTKTVFIGDSRTCGMRDSTGTQAGGTIWICTDNSGYNWLVKTGYPKFKSQVSTSDKCTVYINLGINDLYQNTGRQNKYSKKINAMAKEYSNCTFMVVSVLPVSKAKEGEATQKITNKEIETFNKKMRESADKYKKYKYCDLYTYLKRECNASDEKTSSCMPDGTHYTTAIYKEIYNKIKEC